MSSTLQGNQIVATVRNTQKANCFPLIAEGKVYRISDVKVMNAPTKFRAVDQDKAIVFYHNTKIVPTADTNIIPMYKFDLTTFENATNLVNAVYALIGQTPAVVLILIISVVIKNICN